MAEVGTGISLSGGRFSEWLHIPITIPQLSSARWSVHTSAIMGSQVVAGQKH